MRIARRFVLAGLLLSSAALALPPARPLPPPSGPTVEDVVVGATHIRLWLPDGVGAASRLIVFSHGANANARKYDVLTSAWAAEGHPVAALLHADSPDHPAGGTIGRPEGWADRVGGMKVAIGELQRRFPGLPVVAAGHSYGALVAQALGGARLDWAEAAGPGPDPRVARVVAFSPPGPIAGFVSANGWSEVRVPMLVLTGTADVLPIVAPTWDAHTASFEASSVSPRWLWVGDGVDHYFGNRIGRPEYAPSAEQARLFEAALGTSVAFIEERAVPAQPQGARLAEK